MKMKVTLPKKVKQIIDIFEKNDLEIYVVGGAVRDFLLGKIIYDWDLTTNAPPEKQLELLGKFDAYYTNKFGTVGVPVVNERPIEITTFRTEHGYKDSRRPEKVSWGKSLDEDLQRRDFTINSMAMKINTATCEVRIIDPYKGEKDLEKKTIRAVGDAYERFSEDALRMMRAVRIAAELGFSIEEKTLIAIKSNATSIHKISKERVRDELFKILKSPYPAEGILILRNVGLMEEILPELEKTFGVEQKSPGRHHIYDVGTHLIESLKEVSDKTNDVITRFATLIHDIGKPQTYKKLDGGTITFYNHEMVSTKIATRIADRLRFSNNDKDKLITLVRWHQFSVNENLTDTAIRRFIRNVGIKYIKDMLDLRTGDRLGGGASETSWRLEEFKKRLVEVQKEPFSVRDLKISGEDVMKTLNLNPGPEVGKILKDIFEKVVEKKLNNDKKSLLAELKKYK